jgi:hypothetical protein
VLDSIRDFVLQIEKTLTTRRLYASNSKTYQEASEKIVERCAAATADGPFTIRFGPMDLFFEKTSLIHRKERQDAFFFSLYRDGLRDMTFSSGVTPQALEQLLLIFEAEQRKIVPPGGDTVNVLWRFEPEGITYSAVDGIGDQEGEDDASGSHDDFSSIVSDLAEKIQNPAPALTGQSYALTMDADLRISPGDIHYERSTEHRSFEENPAVMMLTGAEAEAVRAEVARATDDALLDRFIEVLLFILRDPSKTIAPGTLAGIFTKLLDSSWSSHDFAAIEALVRKLHSAVQVTPDPETRSAGAALITKFLTPERVKEMFELVARGEVPFAVAARIWQVGGEEQNEALVEFWATVTDQALRTRILAVLRNRLAANPEILRRTLTSPDAPKVRAALSLLDERHDGIYAKELIALASHSDETLRIRGLAAARRFKGDESVDVLWRAMESDPSKSVRLFAFRSIADAKFPALADKLRSLVSDAAFAQRPAWEREKYVRLLGSIAGASVVPLFQSWIPKKSRLFWAATDSEQAEVAFSGLAAAGPAGLEIVRQSAAAGGKVGEAAQKILQSQAKQSPDASLAGMPAGKSEPDR